MDGLTHSLVGLTSAKAGLERLSPYATLVCVLSANAPDIDVVSRFFGDHWTLIHYHRGITHSIVGVFTLGVLIPSIIYLVEHGVAHRRRRSPRIRYRGLLLASLIAVATHPLMDWTNNYGLRPLLPWTDRWFYGDLVFIIDPYIWLAVGGAAFLLTSNNRLKTTAWVLLGLATSLLILFGPAQRAVGPTTIIALRAIWVLAIGLIAIARAMKCQIKFGRTIAFGALAFVICYWAILGFLHHRAFKDASAFAEQLASKNSEHVIRVAAMPTVANPFRWQSVAETDRAIYRFFVETGKLTAAKAERFEKQSGANLSLASEAAQDRRAQIFLRFARFPFAQPEEGCAGQTLVQFVDLRYTEPGAPLGNFSLNVPVECPAR